MGVAGVNNVIVTVLSTAAAGLVFWPDIVSKRLEASTTPGVSTMWSSTTLLRFLHLASFSTAFGAALWVSFIGGIIMFRHLPRHQFGNLQAKMFPAYFRLTSTCLATAVGVIAVLRPWSTSTTWEKAQFGTLGVSLLFTLANLLVMEPVTTKLMRERHKVERDEGIGTEPGVSRKAQIEKASPQLQAINKKFMAAHGVSSLLNLFAFLSLVVHAAYLSSRLLL
ncbi:hypothetical protein R1sor_000894 [Riccia sorocarpa]|uniref:TMEM205-like domain-containing protein n=1 Tax=Riccia sorocarpa TaxID=122646 RepID=A0ABD3GWW2_9MARC